MKIPNDSKLALPVLGLTLVIGCQGILGIEDPVRREAAGGAGGAGDSGSGMGGSGMDAGTGGSSVGGSSDGGAGGGPDGGSAGGSAAGGAAAGGSDAGSEAGSGGSGGAGAGGTGTGGDPDGGAEGGVDDGAVSFNEVESSGGVPGDWVELHNTGAEEVDLSGYLLRDGSPANEYRLPPGSVVGPLQYLVLEEAAFQFGLGGSDSVFLFRPDGVTVVASFTWSSHALASYGACPDGSGILVPNATTTKGAPNDCTPYVLINEVESSGGTPGDWVELYNATAIPADVSGWVFRDSDDTHGYAIPAGTVIAPGRFLVLDESVIGFAFAAQDSARLFLPDGSSLVDSHAWTVHASTTFGRCPDGGAFATTAEATKGAPNGCAGATPTLLWPGPDAVATADPMDALGNNLSGLSYEPAAIAGDDLVWTVRNAPSVLHRLKQVGGSWEPDAVAGWSTGRPLRYPNSGGDPDAEGVTRADWADADIYVATERDNEADQQSRPSVLRFVTTSPTTFLVASHEWNLVADLPLVEPNRGLEGIAWLPDTFLVSKGFLDERLSKIYDPTDYPDHGGGLFVVGLEATGTLYVYALDHATSSALRVATIPTGKASVNGIELDRDLGYLWAYCGAACANVSTILDIDAAAGSPTLGRFVARASYLAPSTLVAPASEGLALAPESRCSSAVKPVFWSDDTSSGGHSLLVGGAPCGAFLPPR